MVQGTGVQAARRSRIRSFGPTREISSMNSVGTEAGLEEIEAGKDTPSGGRKERRPRRKAGETSTAAN